MQEGGSLDRLDLAGDVLPLRGEALHVEGQLLLGGALGGGAHDDARRLGQHLFQDLLQTRTLGVGELARDAVHRAVGHVHEVTARQRDLARQTRTLVTHRVFRHLDEHAVARLEGELDAARLVVRLDAVPVDLAGVQHGVTAATDVDEGRLHAGQHVLHTTEVHVADQRRVLVAGDVVLDQHVVFEHRDLDAARLRAHDHDAIDRLTPGEELGLRHDGTTSARFATVATALLLRLEAGGALDALRFGDELDGTLTRGRRRRLSRVVRSTCGAPAAAVAPTGVRRAALVRSIVVVALVTVEEVFARRQRGQLGRVEVQSGRDRRNEVLGQQTQRHRRGASGLLGLGRRRRDTGLRRLSGGGGRRHGVVGREGRCHGLGGGSRFGGVARTVHIGRCGSRLRGSVGRVVEDRGLTAVFGGRLFGVLNRFFVLVGPGGVGHVGGLHGVLGGNPRLGGGVRRLVRGALFVCHIGHAGYSLAGDTARRPTKSHAAPHPAGPRTHSVCSRPAARAAKGGHRPKSSGDVPAARPRSHQPSLSHGPGRTLTTSSASPVIHRHFRGRDRDR
ncbi:hypothetical protein QE412_000622 [Microbacterium trichothecenolyticum]|uniref:Uncharacterized protein n=1 Tax=Microbacterium trichothecenolyticum TaxID=69370 RepID=A0ABU0TQV3_MICTR|nr:hypothetical protein [Microbacterium trichothecenolyticum]